MPDFRSSWDSVNHKGVISQFAPWVSVGSVVPNAAGTLGTLGTFNGTTFLLDGARELLIVPRGTQAAGGSPDFLMIWYNVPDGVNKLTNEQASFSIPTTANAGFTGPSTQITGFGRRIDLKGINNTATSVMTALAFDVYAR